MTREAAESIETVEIHLQELNKRRNELWSSHSNNEERAELNELNDLVVSLSVVLQSARLAHSHIEVDHSEPEVGYGYEYPISFDDGYLDEDELNSIGIVSKR